MPSYPKYFNARPSPYTRRSTVLILCLVIGLTGFLFGFVAITRSSLGSECKTSKPRSVSVVWERSGGGNSRVSDGDSEKRHKVMGFVGIQSGFGSAGRRRSLRKTWMPSDQQGLQRYNKCVFSSFIHIIACICIFGHWQEDGALISLVFKIYLCNMGWNTPWQGLRFGSRFANYSGSWAEEGRV